MQSFKHAAKLLDYLFSALTVITLQLQFLIILFQLYCNNNDIM